MLHRFTHRFMLMNAQDGSPGGGSSSGSSPPAPQAQGGGIDVNALATQLVTVLAPQIRDSVFADARRAGLLGGRTRDQDPPPNSTTPQQQTQTPPSSGQPQPLTQDTVTQMLQRRDELFAALDGVRLSPAARARITRDLERDAPQDVAAWTRQYLTDFGLASSAGGGPQPPSTPTSPQGPPVSGTGGAPPPSSIGTSEDTPVWKLSEADRAHLIKTKGVAYFRERYNRNLRATRVRVRNY